MMKQNYDLFEIVSIKQDILEHSLKKGDKGTIVLIYDSNPIAYEIEFCGNDIYSSTLLTLTEQFIEKDHN